MEIVEVKGKKEKAICIINVNVGASLLKNSLKLFKLFSGKLKVLLISGLKICPRFVFFGLSFVNSTSFSFHYIEEDWSFIFRNFQVLIASHTKKQLTRLWKRLK